MAETQVLGWGTGSAPLSRTTRGTERFGLLALDATFDGTGAASSFVPTVQVISDAGEEVGSFPLQTTLSVGDSATVTFAPFLRTAAASAAIVTQSASYSGNNVNIGSGATGTITWDSFDAGDDLLDLSAPGAPTVRTAGLYIVTSLVQCTTGGISFRQSFGFSSAGPGSAGGGLTGDLSGLGATGFVTLTIAAILSAGDGLTTTVLNQGGLAANFFELQGSVARIA